MLTLKTSNCNLLVNMLEISTQLFPYRLKLENRQPVELTVSIKNLNREPSLISYDISIERTLSFDKGGYKAAVNNKVGVIAPGASTRTRYDIYAKHSARSGPQKIYIRATEHYNNYSLVKSEYTKTVEVTVV